MKTPLRLFPAFLLLAFLAFLGWVPTDATGQIPTVESTFRVFQTKVNENVGIMWPASSGPFFKSDDGQSYSMGFWFRRTGDNGSGTESTIVSVGRSYIIGNLTFTRNYALNIQNGITGGQAQLKLTASRRNTGDPTAIRQEFSANINSSIDSWHYVFLTHNQSTGAFNLWVDGNLRMNVGLFGGVDGLPGIPSDAPVFVMLGGFESSATASTNNLVANFNGEFHTFTLWKGINQIVTNFNNDNVRRQGAQALLNVLENRSEDDNITLINALDHYISFDGDLRSDYPVPPNENYFLWQSRIGNFLADRPPEFPLRKQLFEGSPVGLEILVQPLEALPFVRPLLQPNIETVEVPKGKRVSFKSPEYIYVDRHGNTLIPANGAEVPSPDVIQNHAVTRWKTLGYTVAGTSISGTERAVELVATEAIKFEWQFQKEVALVIDSAVPTALRSPASGNPNPPVNKHWFAEGSGPAESPRIEGSVFEPDSANDVRYRIRGYELQGPASRPLGTITPATDRYLKMPAGSTFSGSGNALASATGISASFWLRAPTLKSFAIGMAGFFNMNGAANGGLTINIGGVTLFETSTDEESQILSRSDAWQHWAVTYDSDSQQGVLYLNGVPIRVATVAGEVSANSVSFNALGGATDLDGLRIWSRPLEAREIQESMDSPTLSPALLNGNRINLAFDDPPGHNVANAANDFGLSYFIPGGRMLLYFYPGSDQTVAATAQQVFRDEANPVTDRFFIPLQIANDQQVPAFVLSQPAAIRWHWQKEYRIENLTVNGLFDPALSTSSGKSGILNRAGILWVREGDSLTVSASKDTAGNSSVNGFVGLPSGLFENVTFVGTNLSVAASPLGLTSNSIGDFYTISSTNVSRPGRIIWNYGSTIYVVELALGGSVNPTNMPVLSPGGNLSTRGLSTTAEVPYTITQLVGDNPTDATVSNVARWDAVARLLYPVRPGQFLMSWKAADGGSDINVRVIAGFPGDTYTYDNGTTRTFPSVSTGFPGWPVAHYEVLYNDDDEVDVIADRLTPPIALDADDRDRWFFDGEKGLAYSERITRDDETNAAENRVLSSTKVDENKQLQISEKCRNVLVFSVRLDPEEVATGDSLREIMMVRVVESYPIDERKISHDNVSIGDGGMGRFDGGTSFRVNNAPSLTGGPVTVDLWAKREPSEGHGEQVLFTTGNSQVLGGFKIGFRSAASGGAFFFRSQNTVRELFLGFTDTRWHHWAVSTGSGSVRIYRDGVEVMTFSLPAFNGTSTWTVGADESGASRFEGLIDQVRVWDTVVERQEMFAAMTVESPVVIRNNQFVGPRVNFTFNTSDFRENEETSEITVLHSGASSTTTGSVVGTAAADPVPLFLTAGEDSHPEVATRITSRLDLAGLRTGFITRPVSNYHAGLYDRGAAAGEWGPIYPVNAATTSSFVPGTSSPDTVWYRNSSHRNSVVDPNVAWPYIAVSYNTVRFPQTGPLRNQRLYIASRLGSEGVDFTGAGQQIFEANRFSGLAIYQQSDPEAAGYNPNEEHALVAPSVRHLIGGAPATNNPPQAVFALRNDLNLTDARGDYTSEPWVLAQYVDTETGEAKMSAWKVEKTRNATVDFGVNIERRGSLYPKLGYDKTDFVNFLKPLVTQPANPIYDFHYPTFAGDPLAFPYPLNVVIGASVPAETSVTPWDLRRVFWKDHKGNPWVVSGREPSVAAAPVYEARFDGRFWYPLQPGFWFDLDNDGSNDRPVGFSIPWLPENGVLYPEHAGSDVPPVPQAVRYEAFWKDDYPVIKTGETLTYAGGEYKKDHPKANGLPAVVGWAAGQVVFDTANPPMLPIAKVPGATGDITKNLSSARIIRPLDHRSVAIDADNDLPKGLNPANNNVLVRGTQWFFTGLSASLQKRVVYDTIQRRLTVRGLLNDLDISDPALTTTPISLYVLDPNILSEKDRDALKQLDDDAGTPTAGWDAKIDALYQLTRNPEALDLVGSGNDPDISSGLYYAGLMPRIERDANGNFIFDTNVQTGIRTLRRNQQSAEPLMSLGAGSALVVSPRMLDFTAADFQRPIYVTLAENNHPDLGAAPVSLHVVRISPQRFRGGLKEVLPANAFDEKITFRHTADFGGAVEDVHFEWYALEVDGEIPQSTPSENAVLWRAPLSQGGNAVTTPSLDMIGLPERLLADHWLYARYRKAGEGDFKPEPVALQGEESTEAFWIKPSIAEATPFQWAGANNSPQIQANGSLRYVPALATGWVKRVLDRINPYESRITDFYNNTSPATYTSMIQQAGARPLGPVALNSDKNVVENVGLIALYQTVLDRAFNLASATLTDTNGVQQAMLLAATRISDFYMLLGNEAYSDALDPTIGLGTASIEYGKFAPTVWSFQNQEANLLQEELALLRGSDFAKAWPVDNRLFWNFVKGEGEAAYVNNYLISDSNHDGFINEFDAAELFPQGHGDAWGHYTSSLRVHYRLLQSTFFRWLSRSEFYNLADNVLEVDYLDEQKFAEKAAARARAGTAIVRNTYRAAYTANPDGQWQGYTDVDSARAWGVAEWGKRAGQGAYFDWLTANSLLPAEAPDRSNGQPAENLEKLDRSTITAVSEVATSFQEIQTVLDDAALGVTPVGVGEDAVPFDIDPTFLEVGSGVQGDTHFEQIYQRAIGALQNAITAFNHANEADQRLRQVAINTQQLSEQAVDQDIAYRNGLKKLLGSPYSGTIGAGKLYPEGYTGPDLFLFPYVDRINAFEYLPPESGAYQDILIRKNPQATGKDTDPPNVVTEVPEGFIELYSIPEASYSLADFFRTYLPRTFTDFSPDGSNPTLGTTFALGQDYNALFANYPLPLYANSTYGLQAPPEWGTRSVTGEMQSSINSLTGAQLDVLKAVDDYQAYLRELTTDLDVMFQKQEIMLEQTDAGNALLAAQKAVNAAFIVADVAKAAVDTAQNTVEGITTAALEAFPKVVGVANDLTFAGRAGTIIAKTASVEAFDGAEKGIEIAKSVAAFAFEVVEGNFEIYDDVLSRRQDLIASTQALQQKVNNESTLRFAIGAALNNLVEKEQEFSRLVDESAALLEERMTANQRIAANVQRERYNDMTLRVAHNDALQKYRDAYELAARYAYLATKAFAYETNLADNHPSNPTSLLTEIVAARLPGHMEGNEPTINGGGLASILAKLWANFGNLRGQLGINQPQFETGKFSLRHELFRVKKPGLEDGSLPAMESDQRWRQVLNDYMVPNLWNIPEFRTFCVPPWAESEGAQPGLVIPFESHIFEGKNFFGWPLAARDQSYDSTHFSTKIIGAGIWMEGYDGTNLAVAPRVWLVPAGDDVMRIPRSPTLQSRRWSVVDQAIPVPYVINQSNLVDPRYISGISSLTEPMGAIRRYSRMRAYHDDGGDAFAEDEVVPDIRLVGRSVWNTKWVLIIPGSTLSADGMTGLRKLIGNNEAPGIRDIRLIFHTYSASGN
ncbi:LamG domain-containing protein [Phragmitibacter flavus]|nr:LamG domain-containing protein [Phragmitibacter flavus]